jgi:hypothetical protein
MREWLEAIIPAEIDESIQNLYAVRNKLRGDFSAKLKRMDEITASFIPEKN